MAFLQIQCYSNVLEIQISVWALLPESARSQIGISAQACDGLPPVLYLLHGLSDDHTMWMRQTSIERYAEQRGLVVIMPAVNRSFYSDMVYGANYLTFIGTELPEIMAKLLRISNRREDTFVAGLSMGGYGAFTLAMSRPERFSAAASLSGSLNLFGNPIETTDNSPMFLKDIQLCFEAADQVKNTTADTAWLVQNYASTKKHHVRFYQCCGTEDFLYGQNVAFRDHARMQGLDLLYEEGPGNHVWGYWDRQIAKAIEWLPIERP